MAKIVEFDDITAIRLVKGEVRSHIEVVTPNATYEFRDGDGFIDRYSDLVYELQFETRENEAFQPTWETPLEDIDAQCQDHYGYPTSKPDQAQTG